MVHVSTIIDQEACGLKVAMRGRRVSCSGPVKSRAVELDLLVHQVAQYVRVALLPGDVRWESAVVHRLIKHRPLCYQETDGFDFEEREGRGVKVSREVRGTRTASVLTYGGPSGKQ